jgi:hypothetical protein
LKENRRWKNCLILFNYLSKVIVIIIIIMVMKAIIIITSVAVLIKNMKTIKIIIKINSQKNKV